MAETKAQLRQKLKDLFKDIPEADLTDEELAERQSIYQQLSTAIEPLDRQAIETELEKKFKSYGVSRKDEQDEIGKKRENEAKRIITDRILAEGSYPSAEDLHQALQPLYKELKQYPGVVDPLINFVNDQDARNYLSGFIKDWQAAPDTSLDIKRVEDILAGRKKETEREQEITSFIEGIPGELARPTQERIALLRELGSKRFKDLAPQAIAREQALGRGSSGAVGDVLASLYGDIQSPVETEAARLISEDDAFYFNAAYQNQVRKMLEGRTDLASSLSLERQNIRTQQEQRFQQGQFDINANLSNDLLMQRYENQIRAAQTAREKQQALQDRARGAGFRGTLGGIGGTILGATIGGLATATPGGLPVAAGIGLGAAGGGAIGQGLPLLFGSQ